MAYRTPDDRFADLPDFPYEPQYLEHDGLRIAYLDEGPRDGPAIWLMHGEPTWSFLYRKVMEPLLAAGFRCLVPDLVGFGRSDKPEQVADYTYEKHVAWMSAVVKHLAPTDCTMVVHDWGGPIGMRLFVEHPDAFGRIAIMDTGFFTGEQRMSEAWKAFRDFTERTEDLPVGFLVNGGAKRELPPEVIAAYDAPFPQAAAKAGARAFPLMIPTTPDAVGADAGRALRDAMIADEREKLLLWADGDPIIPMSAGEKMAELLGAPIEPIPGASHFLQEDAGAAIGERLVRWLS